MRALVKLTWVELKLFVREPVTLVFTLILPLIFLIVMGEVFGKNPSTDSAFRGVNAMDYYTPTYVGIVLAAVGLVAIPVAPCRLSGKGHLAPVTGFLPILTQPVCRPVAGQFHD